MINRSGRYHARLVVPKDLRKIVGKTELRAPLGGDYYTVLKMLPARWPSFNTRSHRPSARQATLPGWHHNTRWHPIKSRPAIMRSAVRLMIG
ncbi:MAG TPA: hypothetical protein VIN05_03590 [Roseovarius sp.]